MASLKTTITNSGLALIEKVVAGSGQIEFTTMAVGDGVNINTSNLVTELVNKRIEVEVSKVYSSDEGTVVCGNVENSTVTESFEIREVGVYAREAGSENTILFSYTECEGIGGIPSADIVLINNEMLITIVTGQAEVIYIDNPNATTTRQDVIEQNQKIDELYQHLKENYFTKSDIQSGVQTQSIFGYDPMGETDVNNNIYLTGGGITAISKGNVINFPSKSGTLALLSDIEESKTDVKTEVSEIISEKTTLLETVPAASTDNANCYGYAGTLRNLGAFGDAVSVESVSVFTRSQGTNSNADIALWCRILKVVNGTWVIAAQSETSRKWNEVALGAELRFQMKAIAGVIPPSADDKIAIVWVNDTNAEATACNGQLSFSVNQSVGGGITSPITSSPSTSGGQSWSPVFKLRFTPMTGEKQVATKEELDALTTTVNGKVDKATTLSGYGITDAYTKAEVDTAIANVSTGGDSVELTVEPTIVSASGGTVTVNITTESTWDFDFEALRSDWGGTLTQSVGSGSTSFTLDIPANTSGDVRSGTLWLSSGGVTRTVSLTQLAVSGSTSTGFGIDTTAATSYTATETYDETSGYTYTCPITASENGYLSCQITQTHESDATNKIILSCTIDGVVAHKDCAYGYGDMASILIPVATGQVINVEATSSEPATMEAKFMPLKS